MKAALVRIIRIQNSRCSLLYNGYAIKLQIFLSRFVPILQNLAYIVTITMETRVFTRIKRIAILSICGPFLIPKDSLIAFNVISHHYDVSNSAIKLPLASLKRHPFGKRWSNLSFIRLSRKHIHIESALIWVPEFWVDSGGRP